MTLTAAAIAASAPALLMLPVEQLAPGDDFRIDEDLDALSGLAESIAQHGVLQPLTVRQVAGGWEVVAGRRRLAAARIAGLDVVPCLQRALNGDEAADLALTENIHRRDLSAVEEGLALARLRDQGLTQTQIAKRVGRSQNHVSMLLRVLELPAEMRDKIHLRQMSYVTALDLWGRKRFRNQETPPRKGGGKGRLTGDDAALVSHWRRRHDRIVAGIHAVLKELTNSDTAPAVLLDRVLKLDREPFPDDTGAKS